MLPQAAFYGAPPACGGLGICLRKQSHPGGRIRAPLILFLRQVLLLGALPGNGGPQVDKGSPESHERSLGFRSPWYGMVTVQQGGVTYVLPLCWVSPPLVGSPHPWPAKGHKGPAVWAPHGRISRAALASEPPRKPPVLFRATWQSPLVPRRGLPPYPLPQAELPSPRVSFLTPRRELCLSATSPGRRAHCPRLKSAGTCALGFQSDGRLWLPPFARTRLPSVPGPPQSGSLALSGTSLSGLVR